MRFPARLWLQSALLAVIGSWPLLPQLATAAVGSPESDTPKHLWTLWWMREQLYAGGGQHTTLVNFPEGMTLFPIEPLNGLLAALVPLPVVATSNLLALLHLTLTGVCAGWLGRMVSRSELGGHAAAALLQGSAFVAFTLHVGVGELRQVWWLPLGLGCLVRAHETLAWRWFAALAAVLAGAVLACFYHGLFLATATAIWALTTLRPNVRLLVGYAGAAALSLAIVWPVVTNFSAGFGQGRPQEVFDAGGRVVLQYRDQAAHLDDLLRWKEPGTTPQARQERAYAGGRYLGGLVVMLALAGVAAAPRRAIPWLLVALAGAVLSLGSVLWWGNRVPTWSGEPLVLPLAHLNQALTRIAEPINFPARFLALTSVGLAVLGALAMRWPKLAWLLPFALIDVAVHDLAVFPRRTLALPSVAGLSDDTLLAAGVSGPLADLSLAAEANEESRLRSIAVQLATGAASQGVPIERLDGWAPQGTQWLRTLNIVGVARLGAPGAPTVSEAALASDLAALRERGFGGLLLTHRGEGPSRATDALLSGLCGPPVRSPHATVWRIP